MDEMKDIYRKELSTALPGSYEFYKGSNTPYVGQDKAKQSLCFQLQKLATDIVSHRYAQPFFVFQRYKKTCAGASMLGTEILKLLQLISDEQLPEFIFGGSHVSMAPDLNVLIKVLQAALTKDGGFVQEAGHVAVLTVHPENYLMLLPDEVPNAVKELNTLAAILRKTLRTQKMRDTVKSFRRNATERYNQAMRVAHQAWILRRKTCSCGLTGRLRSSFQ